MNNYLNVLTTDGFKALSKLDNDMVYLNTKELKKIHNYNPNYKSNSNTHKVTLVTGTSFTCDNKTVLNGLIFENYIKNELDNTYIDKYKINDYIYTPYIDLNLDQNLLSISLKNYTDNYIIKGDVYYLTKDINKDYDINLRSLFKLLKNEYVEEDQLIQLTDLFKANNLNIDLDEHRSLFINHLTSTYFDHISESLFVTKKFIDFLLCCVLRSKISHSVSSFNNVIKRLSFKFNKSNEQHKELSDNLEQFLLDVDYKYEVVDYNNYYFINIINNPIIDYYEHFYTSNFNDLKYIDNDLKLYFITKLYEYTNNNYYSNYDIYLTLKYICFNFKIILSHQRNKNTNTQPYVSSILTETDDVFDEFPDLVLLEEGYLTRIIDIKTLNTNNRIDLASPFLIVG